MWFSTIKMLLLGYFPEVKCYPDIKEIIKKKQQSFILWGVRFIELKHPKILIIIAKRLKNEEY